MILQLLKQLFFLSTCMVTVTYEIELDNITNTTIVTPELESSYNGSSRIYSYALSRGFSRTVAGCFLTIIIIAVSCNSLLIATITAVPRLHSYMHVFIVNMAFSDLITALGTIPFDVEFMLRGYIAYGKVLCGIMHITFLISLPSSVLCLSLLTAERFISVVFPFRVRQIVTKKTVSVAVIATWSYVILTGFFPLMLDKDALVVRDKVCNLRFPLGYQMFQVVANFLVPTVIIFGVNVILFRISHKHASKNASVSSNESRKSKKGTKSDDDHKSLFPRRQVSCMAMSSLARNMKAVKRIALLVGVFLVCWLSYIIIVAMNYVCYLCHPRELTWVANIINYSSTAINPVLYGLLNKMIRREVFRNLNRICKACLPCLYENNFNRKFKMNTSLEMKTRRTFMKNDKCKSFSSNFDDRTTSVTEMN